jgi:serine/threonine protein kinase
MVLNSGHDQGVDKWALGVLMYEMLTGNFTELSPKQCIIRSYRSMKLLKTTKYQRKDFRGVVQIELIIELLHEMRMTLCTVVLVVIGWLCGRYLSFPNYQT